MSGDNAAVPEPTLFSATITPHRSLGSTGFLALMLGIGGVSFVAGVMFLLIGAWPVFGFLGLDVLLIYWAFRINYRAARAYEEVTVTTSELTVRKVSHRGSVREMDPQPAVGAPRARRSRGVRHRTPVPDLSRPAIVDRRLPGPGEKASFAGALSAALSEAKRGPTRTVP